MKKGFTLIELLAVIVILAVIALISTPLILNIVDEAKKGALKNSTYGIIKAAEFGYTDNILSGSKNEVTFTYAEGVETSAPEGEKLEYTGAKPQNGLVVRNNEGQVAIAIYDGVWCAKKNYEESEVTILSKENTKECIDEINYKDQILKGTDPVLKTGMIPVVLSNDGTVKVANIYLEWHDYLNKKWANVVTVSETDRSKYINADGTYNFDKIIPETEILTYFVWIPRYKYKIFNDGQNISVSGTDDTNITTIEVIFENNETVPSNNTTTGEYLTHPAFTFGTTDGQPNELNGFWVGKFESSQKADNDATILIKPNRTSKRSTNVADMFKASIDIKNEDNVYGLNSNEVDSHLSRNMEWGAIAYLSHSIYGINEEIRYNNSSTYITGCAATNIPTTGYLTTGYAGCENAYNTAIGYLASTTGNITGIYDMSGGSWEYVMGIMQDNTGTNTPITAYSETSYSGFNGPYADGSGTYNLGIDLPDSKYYDLYDYGTTWNDITAFSRGKLGDATKEMESFGSDKSSWYNDKARMPFRDYYWMRRGGCWEDGIEAGVFTFFDGRGGMDGRYSFRVIVA